MRQLRFLLTCTAALAAVWLLLANLHVAPVSAASPQGGSVVTITMEADSRAQMAEFIELYDGGVGNTPLDGLVLVFYNGSNDLSYLSFDLDGQSTDTDGYFVLCGDAANTPNCEIGCHPNAFNPKWARCYRPLQCQRGRLPLTPPSPWSTFRCHRLRHQRC
ncbi:MAG: hypothetical protein IPL28_13450 [Chloroflexi bacterium]|nr:hypothetical protein [Chloroflexota bacterium]